MSRSAQRHHPEELPGALRALGVEILHGAPQLEQSAGDLRPLRQAALVERLDRGLEQPVARLRGLADVGVAHRPHVLGLRGEVRAARSDGEQRGQVAVDLRVELRRDGGVDGGGDLRRLRRGDRLDRLGRGQGQGGLGGRRQRHRLGHGALLAWSGGRGWRRRVDVGSSSDQSTRCPPPGAVAPDPPDVRAPRAVPRMAGSGPREHSGYPQGGRFTLGGRRGRAR